MNRRSWLLVLIAFGIPVVCAAQESKAPAKSPAKVAAPAAIDVLDRPAQMTPLAARRLLQSVARVGDRLVAVGPRGHIVVSTDAGATWKQSVVPVSSDLTAVYFANDKSGWAVGHDGVVLATTDGGETWAKQLDGRAANGLLLKHLEERAKAEPASAELKSLLAEAERYMEQGPDKPFLDVWFQDDKNGYVVGAYNLIFATSDGGKNWEPWFDRTDNPKFLSLYSIRPAAGGLYIAGEAGLVLRFDPAAKRFRAVPVDYKGSLFGILDGGDAVLVFGLKGNVFRSDNGGKSWTKIDSQLPATIVSGVRTEKGALVIADQGGRLSLSTDGGKSFNRVKLAKSIPVTSLIDAGAGKLAFATPVGVLVVDPAAAAAAK
jgi:photosystem II stability/assembly factor-like uncharacterized protein